jgi:predicted NUDIX family NTP pyrophosphohydrolase
MRISAGLLMYRRRGGDLEVLLVHPGGPFFVHKDEGVWSVPKGEVEGEEDLLSAAQREFREETGFTPHGPYLPLTPVMQPGGKLVHCWAFEGDCDPATLVSNTFTLEWPPRSGRQAQFPEVDRAAFFDLATARTKINPAQVPLLDQLQATLRPEG